MEITYFGHSCFKIEKDGFSIIIDPYKTGSVPGYEPLKEKANSVLSTHRHDDHFGLSEVRLSDTRIDTPFVVDMIETYHDDKEGALRGTDNVIIIEADGMKIVHMGDIGCDLPDEDLEKIKGCDVLMIPVGGFFTIDAGQAFRMIGKIEPATAIPMHYRGPSFGYDVIGTLETFTDMFDEKDILRTGSVIELDSRPAGHKITVMKPMKA
ncbi:MAG: MBL fold metallo-hydrolase [Clostridiales bacterium]|nr:MBL fold metallo-hydrolase [Clostridiales bacterium]